ncbi:MAG: GNAT family N-acetyltransferase [Oscillospiraceae bacterium]|nr:GNAT family N-acetyltransferase [Oscillospiraceae bacterium]
MALLPIRGFDRNNDKKRVQDFFDQMGKESIYFFNGGGGNERIALSFFDGAEENRVYFMAVDGERMVGYLFLSGIDKSVIWLGIAVADDWKGKHLGRDILAKADEYAKENGKGGILLMTMPDNLRAQGLYTRCGYERIGTSMSNEFLYIKRY